MSPLSKFPPADFEEFFRALDRELRRPLTVTVIGGAAIGLKYDPRHATSDIDLTPISDVEFWKAVDRAIVTHPVPVQAVSIYTAPYDYESRRTPLPIEGLERLTVLIPEIHDLAIMKVARALTHDLDAIEDVHRKSPLDLDTLLVRYYEALGQVIGPRSGFTIGFLALVERLFGTSAAERVQHRIENEPPPPMGGV